MSKVWFSSTKMNTCLIGVVALEELVVAPSAGGNGEARRSASKSRGARRLGVLKF